MWWEGFGDDRRGGRGAEPNAEADVLGPESNEQTSAAVVLTLLFGLGRYLKGYGCPIDVDGVVERVRFRRAASSSVSSSTSQPGLIRNPVAAQVPVPDSFIHYIIKYKNIGIHLGQRL